MSRTKSPKDNLPIIIQSAIEKNPGNSAFHKNSHDITSERPLT